MNVVKIFPKRSESASVFLISSRTQDHTWGYFPRSNQIENVLSGVYRVIAKLLSCWITAVELPIEFLVYLTVHRNTHDVAGCFFIFLKKRFTSTRFSQTYHT